MATATQTPDTPLMGAEPSDLQKAAAQVSQLGQLAAQPFIKSASGQQTEAKVVSEVNLGIAALPLLGQLFHAIGNLFHHAHKSASNK